MTTHPGVGQRRGRNTLPRQREVKEERVFLFINVFKFQYKIKGQKVRPKAAVRSVYAATELQTQPDVLMGASHRCKRWQKVRGDNTQLKDRKGRESRTFTSGIAGLLDKPKPPHYDLFSMVVHNDQVLSTAWALICLSSIDFQETFKNVIILETSILLPIHLSKFQSIPLGREGKSN